MVRPLTPAELRSELVQSLIRQAEAQIIATNGALAQLARYGRVRIRVSSSSGPAPSVELIEPARAPVPHSAQTGKPRRRKSAAC